MSAYDDRDYRPPRQNNEGSGCGKIFLILLAITGACTLMLCCGGTLFLYWGFNQLNFSMEPAKVREVAESMLDITIPDDYTPTMSMEIKQLNFAMAAFGDEKQNRGIIMVKHPPGADINSQDEALNKAKGERNFEVEKTEEKIFKLNGKDETFTVQQGKDKNGNSMRQFIGDIKGKSGMVALIMMGAEDKVTDEDFQKLLDSIKTADSKSDSDSEADPEANTNPGRDVVAPPVEPADPEPAAETPTEEKTTEESNTGEKPAAESETDTPTDSESTEKAAAEK